MAKQDQVPRRIGEKDDYLQMFVHADGFYSAIGELQHANDRGVPNMGPPMLTVNCITLELLLKAYKRATSDDGYLATHDTWLLWNDLGSEEQAFILRVHREVVSKLGIKLFGVSPDEHFIKCLKDGSGYFESIRYFYQSQRSDYQDLSGPTIAVREALLLKRPVLREGLVEISPE
jgi:hypothetical protein